jgi:chitinase
VSYGVYAKGSTLPPPNTTPPNVPQYLSVAATGLSTVSFNWYSSGDPANRYVAGYAVYRDNAQIAVTGLTSYQDSGLAKASYHTYTVTAFDSSQNASAEAPPIAVTTFASVPAGVPATPTSRSTRECRAIWPRTSPW